MSTERRSRGMSLPGIGLVIVIAAALCAVWLLSSEFNERGWVRWQKPAPDGPANRNQVVEALVNRGRDAVPELVQALCGSDPKVRRSALYGLSRLGPMAVDALPVVREALADNDAGIREDAVSAFWRISRDPELVAPVVARMLADTNGGVRVEAAKTLESIGPPTTKPVIEMLGSDLAAARTRALHVLRRVVREDSRDEISEAVRGLLDDPDQEIRNHALFSLVGWGTASVAEVRKLLRTDFAGGAVYSGVNEKTNSIEVALDAIIRLGSEAADLVPDLIDLFDKQQNLEEPRGSRLHLEAGRHVQVELVEIPARVQAILKALSALQTAARPAVRHLLRRLDGMQPGNQIAVAATLVEIGATDDEMIPVLMPLLVQAIPKEGAVRTTGDMNEHETARQAGLLLVRVSPEAARRQVSLLIPKLGTAKTGVNTQALFALYGMAREAQEAVPALLPLVSGSDSWIASVASDALKVMGADRTPAVDALVARLKREPDGSGLKSRIDAVQALGAIGPSAKSAVPTLLGLINARENAGRGPSESDIDNERNSPVEFSVSVINALEKIGDDSPPVLSALGTQLTVDSKRIRVAAIEALATLGRSSEAVLADLIRSIDDEALAVRCQAALAIGEMNVDRREAVAPLTAALDDGNPYVRSAAALALGMIGRDAKSALPSLRQALHDERNSFPNSLYRYRRERIKPEMPWLSWPQISKLDSLSVERAVREAIEKIDPGE